MPSLARKSCSSMLHGTGASILVTVDVKCLLSLLVPNAQSDCVRLLPLRRSIVQPETFTSIKNCTPSRSVRLHDHVSREF